MTIPNLRLLRMTLLYTVFSFFLLTLARARENENGGILKGKVTTADNKPADGVTVTIKGTKKTAITKEDGSFYFRNITPGQYTIEVSLVGYTPVQKEVTLEAGKTTAVDLQLALSDQELQNVIVTANRNRFAKMPLKNLENPQVYTTITKELLPAQALSIL
jgi:iron complex outermembrane receptor protein